MGWKDEHGGLVASLRRPSVQSKLYSDLWLKPHNSVNFGDDD